MAKNAKKAQEHIHFSIPGVIALGGDYGRHHAALEKVFGPFPITLNGATDYDVLLGMEAAETGESGVFGRILDQLDQHHSIVLHLVS